MVSMVPMIVLCRDGKAHMRVVRSKSITSIIPGQCRSILPDLRREDAGPVSGQGTPKLSTRISL
jgi:hypothetical protein